jgi:alkanesulfonate monooxygenase SsuD/methylene tetrahydromethanopterin reductase-like flavin-dependent oxidoreductase (luciferase family)
MLSAPSPEGTSSALLESVRSSGLTRLSGARRLRTSAAARRSAPAGVVYSAVPFGANLRGCTDVLRFVVHRCADILPQTLDEQTVLSYTADVPPSVLKQVALTGTPAEVIDQAAEWRDHGVHHPVVWNISAIQPSLRRGVAATIPFVQVLRGLRKL